MYLGRTIIDSEGADFSDQLRADVAKALTHIEASVGKSFGDAADPLLVSVRSGAKVSMPRAKSPFRPWPCA